jgi:hypothetical protein
LCKQIDLKTLSAQTFLFFSTVMGGGGVDRAVNRLSFANEKMFVLKDVDERCFSDSLAELPEYLEPSETGQVPIRLISDSAEKFQDTFILHRTDLSSKIFEKKSSLHIYFAQNLELNGSYLQIILQLNLI